MDEKQSPNIIEHLLDRLLSYAGKSMLNTVALVNIAAVALFTSCWFLTLLPSLGQPAESVETVEVTVIIEETVVVWRTVEVTRLVPVLVTATPSPLPDTPAYTPTASLVPTHTSAPTETPTITPTVSLTPTATHNIALTQTREALGDTADTKLDGTYAVGSQIAVGLWESAGVGTECFWTRKDSAGNTIDSHYGLAGGTINVQSSDAQINFEGCGIFIYVQNAEQILAEDARQTKRDGYYTVGVEIAAGLWRSNGNGDDCYWARLSETQDLIETYRGDTGVDLRIEPHDYEVLLEGCGVWTFIEE